MRDDFPPRVKDVLAKRVGFRCSNPNCRQLTSGPQIDSSKAINVGVAAHITAASSQGPRYDPSLTPEERKDHSNGIWLCQKCAKLIDSDLTRYNIDVLRNWKNIAEETAIKELEGGSIKELEGGSANRIITLKQKSKIVDVLLKNRGSVSITYVRGDRAAKQYAEEIRDIFNTACWHTSLEGVNLAGFDKGLMVSAEKMSDIINVIITAFDTGDISIKPWTNPHMKEEEIALQVGNP